MLRHTLTVLAAAAALLAGACSNGGGAADKAAGRADLASPVGEASSSEEFCAGAAALYDEFDRAGTSDPSSSSVQSLFAAALELPAPAPITADWSVVLDSIAPFVAGDIDLDDPDAMAAATQRFVAAATAYRRVGAYFTDKCGFGATTSDP